mgnify:CR=1 FL=1
MENSEILNDAKVVDLKQQLLEAENNSQLMKKESSK